MQTEVQMIQTNAFECESEGQEGQTRRFSVPEARYLVRIVHEKVSRGTCTLHGE